jgi:hypothetical protein
MAKQTEPKTKVNEASVSDFINLIKDEQTRNDCNEISKMMQTATKSKPKMWGASMVGFGMYHYIYASGREGDWPIIAFSPRKQNITIYIMPGLDQYKDLLKKLGKYTTSKVCLYIKKLADVDKKVLKELINKSVKDMKKIYP